MTEYPEETPERIGLVPHGDICQGVRGHTTGPWDARKYIPGTCPAWHREWMTPDGLVSVHMNVNEDGTEDGTVDEVLSEGAPIHIEQMDDDCYWMSVGQLHLNVFYAPRKRVVLVMQDVVRD